LIIKLLGHYYLTWYKSFKMLSIYMFFFFGFEKTSSPRKVHFVGPGEGVKLRLSQALTRDARPDSNSRPAVQILNPLPLRYAPWGQASTCCLCFRCISVLLYCSCNLSYITIYIILFCIQCSFHLIWSKLISLDMIIITLWAH
jgi:hypothetical protein